MSDPSAIDWLILCDVGIAVRKRATGPLKVMIDDKPRVMLTEEESTVLVCAALEYANRLAYEHGERLRLRGEDEDCGCSDEWKKGQGCPARNCVRR